MKTAEELARDLQAALGNGLRYNAGVQPSGTVIGNFIARVQLDAWKQGVEDAKQIHMNYPPSEHYECHQELSFRAQYGPDEPYKNR